MAWTMSRRQGVVEGLHHLHHRHFYMRGGGGVSRPFDADPMPCGYEVHCPPVAVSKPLEPRRNGLGCRLDIHAAGWGNFLFTIESPRHTVPMLPKSFSKILPMFFWSCKSISKGGQL